MAVVTVHFLPQAMMEIFTLLNNYINRTQTYMVGFLSAQHMTIWCELGGHALGRGENVECWMVICYHGNDDLHERIHGKNFLLQNG